MNILILEDEVYNYDLLHEMLEQQQPGCAILGPIATVSEGQRFFASHEGRIDLIIADVQLSDGLSFYALAHAPSDVPIIFTTAYDEYALRAFEFNSLSYLLKPVDEDELRQAIRKAQERLITDEHREELFALMGQSARYRERFIVRTFKGQRIVPLSQVRYIVSEQKSTFLVLADGTSCEFDKPLAALEHELDPRNFMRVNRKYIVPAAEVEGFERGINGKERLILRGGDAPEITISRDNARNVHQWLDFQKTIFVLNGC